MAEKKTRSADIFFELTKRHLLVFFKNKVRVLYTLLVPVIIFVVYIFFLRGLEIEMVKDFLPEYGLTETDELMRYIGALVDSWMLSGITAISVITVSLQTNNVFVQDKENGVNRDFASSPIHRNILIGSYFLFNFTVTVIICGIFLIVCGIYLACMGEFMLTFANVMTIFAVLLYTTVAATLMTVFISSFVKKEATMASIVAIFSTAIGFLIGAYMPFGMLPDKMRWVENVCIFIPGTHGCSLLRYAFMDTPLNALKTYAATLIDPAAVEQLVAEFSSDFGYNLSFFGTSVGPQWQALANAVFIVVFLALNIGLGKRIADVLGIGKKKKKKEKE